MDSALARLVLRLSTVAEGLDDEADRVLATIRQLVEEGADDERLDSASAQLAHVLSLHAGSAPDEARLAHLIHDLSGLRELVATLPVRGDEQTRMDSLLERAADSRSGPERQRALADFITLATDALRDVTRRDEPAGPGHSSPTEGEQQAQRCIRPVSRLLLRLVEHLDALHGNALRSHALRERLQHLQHFEQLEHFLTDMASELESVDERLRSERRRLADFLGDLRDRLDSCDIELSQLGEQPDAPVADRVAELGTRLDTLRSEASALRNEIRNKTDQHLKDPLTGLYSREGYGERSEELFERWRSVGAVFSLVAVDCLEFADINERRGHGVGDRVLVWVADLLQSRARAGDVVCRLEGARFLVLLPDTATDGAESFAHSASEALQRSEFEDCGEILPLAIACGVTTLVTGDTLESALGRADEAVYEARRDPARPVVTVI